MRWKKILSAAALVVVVLIAVVYVILVNLDFNRYKPQIAKLVYDATGRELTLAGNIEFELGVRPTLIAEDVSFQNAPWSPTPDSVRVKRLEVQIAFLPLLIGKLNFAHLVLIEPTVIVEFDRAGASNFSFDTVSQEDDGTAIDPPPLIFSDIWIEKGQFIYRDAQSNFKFTVRIDRLAAEVPGFDESLQVDFKGAFDDMAFALNGTIGPIWAWVEAGYKMPVDVAITAGGATARLRGEMRDPIHFKDLAFTATADGDSTAELARLAGVTGMPEWGAFKLRARVTDPETHVFSIDSLGIALGANEFSGLVKLNLAKEVPFVSAELSSQQFKFGPAVLNIHITDPIKKPAIKKLDLKFGTEEVARVHLNGIVDDLIKFQGADISFQANGKNLANLEKWVGRPMPVRGAFSATGTVITPGPENLRIPDLKIAAGKNDITGSLNLDLSGDKPQLRADLTSPQLDLPGVLPPDLAQQKWAKGLGLMQPVKLSAKLAGLNREISLEKFDLQAGTAADSADLRLTGSVANLPAQRGVDLRFSLRGDNLVKLKHITGQPYFFAPVPGEGDYAFSGQISDSAPKIYTVKDFRFEMSGNVLTGSMDVNLTGDLPAYQVQLFTPKFNLKPFPIPKEAAYAQLNQIDDLGPLKIQSKVVVKGDRLSMPNLVMQAGHQQLAEIEVKGSIHDLTTQTGIDLDFNIRGNDIANLKKITGQSLPIEGAYGLSARLTDPAPNNYKLGDLKLTLGANNITGVLDLELGGKQFGLTADLAAPAFTLQPVTLPALETLGRIEDLGPLVLAFKVGGAGQKFSLDSLDFNLGRKDLIEILLKGTISDLGAVQGMQLKFSARGSDMSKFKEVGGPVIPFEGSFDITAQVSDPAPKVYKIPSFNATVGENNQSGWLELDTTGDRPRLTGELSSEKLDLRPLLAHDKEEITPKEQSREPVAQKDKESKAKTRSTESGDQQDKVFSDKPLQFKGLQVIDADLKFRDKQVLLPNLALDDVTLDLRLKNGHLEIKPFKFSIGGGKADVQFALQSQDESAAVTAAINIEQLAIGPMMDKLGYQRSVEGNMDADLKLDSTGNSVAVLMADLNGSTRIAMSEGRVASGYLELLEKYLGSGILGMINPFQEKREYTPVNCFVNKIEIKDGLADVRIVMDTDRTTIIGAGDVNLKTESLDLGLKPTPKKGAMPADISFSFKQLSQPFRLGGTLAHPQLTIDAGRTAFVIGKIAGAVALGPIGIAAFFADVSVGKQDACAVALGQAEIKDPSAGENKAEDSSEAAANGDEKKEEKKSGRVIRHRFEQ
jgi:uncharacterized protein involved in outer membrane biogenesis